MAVVSLLRSCVGKEAEEASVKAMMRDLVGQGPQALHEMWQRLEASSEDVPGRTALQEVKKRFEQIVIEAEFYPTISPEMEGTNEALAALVGKPLTAEPLLRVLSTFASSPPAGARALEVTVHRAEGGAPLSVSARCVREVSRSVLELAKNRRRIFGDLWLTTLDYVSGDGASSGQGDSLDDERARLPASYLDLAKGIEKTLRASTGGKLALKLMLLRPQGQ